MLIGVVDTGIDTDNIEFTGKISGASIDIVSPSTPLADSIGHGTSVAGVLAAARNGTNTHGVAFDSNLLVVRADLSFVGCPDICGFSNASVADAINHAVANGASVINLSLGGQTMSDNNVQQAMINATNNGVIIVAAAGNDGLTTTSYPAAFAGDPRFNGLVLAVGAVDSLNQNSGFHNLATDGTVADFFVVAPGVSIRTTAAGGGIRTVSGTSYSAPHVAGAAAVLKSLFPSLTSQQIVNLLLSTAIDLGDTGTDLTFGRGLINLALAIQPAGTLRIPLTGSVSGRSETVASTSLTFGPAFGDALVSSTLLAEAVFLDDYDRAYKFDLSDHIRRPQRTFGFDSLAVRTRTEDVELPEFLGQPAHLMLKQIGLPQSDNRPGSDVGSSGAASFADVYGDQSEQSLLLNGSLGPNTRFSLQQDGPGADLLKGPADTRLTGMFWSGRELLDPQQQFVGSGEGLMLTQRLDSNLSLSFARFESSADEGPRGTLNELSITQALSSGADIGVSIAAVEEDGTFLGSTGTGAFGAAENADGSVVTFHGSMPLVSRVSLFGSFSVGQTEAPDNAGALLTGWSDIKSNAFGAGVVMRDALFDRDQVGLLVGQPLRVYDGSATLTVPVGRDVDGNVLQRSEKVSLTPSGREIDLQLAYERTLSGDTSISSWAMMRLEPNHDASADPDYGIGMTFRFNW